MPEPPRNYLVIRDREHDTTTVLDFGHNPEVTRYYEREENEGSDCVLLGSWSVADLEHTHASWFLGKVDVKNCEDWEPLGAGADPYGRPDPRTHPDHWTE